MVQLITNANQRQVLWTNAECEKSAVTMMNNNPEVMTPTKEKASRLSPFF